MAEPSSDLLAIIFLHFKITGKFGEDHGFARPGGEADKLPADAVPVAVGNGRKAIDLIISKADIIVCRNRIFHKTFYYQSARLSAVAKAMAG